MRHTRNTIMAFLACCSAAFLRAADEYEVKVYPCPLTAEAITVDGRLDESAWQTAPLVGGFTFYNRPELAPTQTFFRVLHTATHLYFGVRCDEPLMKRLVPVVQARDAKPIFSGEAVEFFVDPAHDHDTYFQFAVDAAGSIYDARGTDPMWNGEIEAGAAQGQDAWTLELAIPWVDLGVSPASGKVIGINLCRDRLLGQSKQWTNWSQTKSNFHDPVRFGHLVLAAAPKTLGTLGSEFRKGNRAGPIMIYSSEGFSDVTYRALAGDALGKLAGRLEELRRAAEAESSAATKRELLKLVARFEKQIAPVRAAVEGREEMDAASWTRMDLTVNQILHALDEAIWDARLAALLAEL